MKNIFIKACYSTVILSMWTIMVTAQMNMGMDTNMTDTMHNMTDTMHNMTDTMHNMTDTMHNMTDTMHNMTDTMHNMTDHMHNMTGNVHNMTDHMHNMTDNVHNMTDHMHNMTGSNHDMDHGMDHDGDHGMDHGTDHGTDHGVGHSLYFYFGTEETLLFKQWVTTDSKSLGLACLYVALVAIFYEGLKLFRNIVYKWEKENMTHSKEQKYSMRDNAPSCCSPCGLLMHLFQTVLHMLQVFLSLCLMLVFMTFNVYLCIAVIGGAGVGYLLFGWKRMNSEDDEHCN